MQIELYPNNTNKQENNINKNLSIAFYSIFSLICFTLLIISCYSILSNEIAYNEYATSSEIRKTEVEITDIETTNIFNENDSKTGERYNYSIKFTVDNVEYKSNLIEENYFYHEKKAMNIGDKTVIDVYKDKKGNYKVPKFTSLEAKDNENKNLITGSIFIGLVTCVFILGLLLTLHSKDGTIVINNPKLGAIFTNFFVCLICGVFITSGIIIIIKYNNNNVLNNVLTFIFFICFPVLLGVLLLYASNQYYANQSKKIKLDKKVINKK